MTESERRPERNPGDYEPAEDPDTDAPASGERDEREREDDAASREEEADEPDHSALAKVSNEMVRLYKEQFGRGPRRVRAHWCGEDALCVVLEGTLAPAERSLIALGEHQHVRETRLIFQYATLPEFCAPVERITGRKVRAFVSGIDSAVDGLSIESFVFYPVGAEAGRPSRIELAPRR